VVTAAADEQVLAHPSAVPSTAAALMILGGSALYLAGHAAFNAIVWRTLPLTRLTAIVVLGLLGLAATRVSSLALGVLAAVVLIALAASDRLVRLADRQPRSESSEVG
jgi:low temperature requirement protein LtrA